MYISGFQINNYKSHYQSAALHLTPGFNLITGQNNAGKTALLEALSLRFGTVPHRSLKTLPTANAKPNPKSWAEVAFTVSREELLEIVAAPNRTFYFPLPKTGSPLARTMGYTDPTDDSVEKLQKWLASTASVTFVYRVERSGTDTLTFPDAPQFKGYQAAKAASEDMILAGTFRVDPEKQLIASGGTYINKSADVRQILIHALVSGVYLFKAERFNAGTSSFGRSRVLAPDAHNLPEVLNILQSNRQRFERFNHLVHQILPQVRWISVRPYNSNDHVLEIVVWPHDPATEREDLAIPLNESGTGIGQVLAILYVALNSDSQRTIIIDEPQSFLHRGATRKLIEVLKTQQRHEHQYIVSTHSPTVISATNPSTITMLQQHEGETTSVILDASEIRQQRLYLAEVGATPADVFGYDNILWVEGETEETCFPMIVERVGNSSMLGTAIRRVKHTGDFEAKAANLIFDIYDRLSHGNSLLPPAIQFVFDDECRTEAQKRELQRRGSNKVTFLPRRMYENYLLNPEAIAAVINQAITDSVEDYQGALITEDEVRTLLKEKSRDPKYFNSVKEQAGQEDWATYIHAGNVLNDLFGELTKDKAPITFGKTTHSVILTEWLIEYAPEGLMEVSELLTSILNQGRER